MFNLNLIVSRAAQVVHYLRHVTKPDFQYLYSHRSHCVGVYDQLLRGRMQLRIVV